MLASCTGPASVADTSPQICSTASRSASNRAAMAPSVCVSACARMMARPRKCCVRAQCGEIAGLTEQALRLAHHQGRRIRQREAACRRDGGELPQRVAQHAACVRDREPGALLLPHASAGPRQGTRARRPPPAREERQSSAQAAPAARCTSPSAPPPTASRAGQRWPGVAAAWRTHAGLPGHNPRQCEPERLVHLLQHSGCLWKLVTEILGHPHPLAALSGEHHGHS